MKWVPFQSPSIRKPRREFCWLKWNSERLPLATLLNETLPKLEPMLDPAFLSRQKGVKSINPMGTRQTPPSRKKVGTVLSTSASQGFWAEPVGLGGAACGTGSGVPSVVTAGKGGRIGVVEAICPMPREVVGGKEISGFAATVESLLFWSVIVRFSSSIWRCCSRIM